jgi:hypothetical protein
MFPHVAAHAAGTSFRAAVEALRDCQDLREALHATHALEPRTVKRRPADSLAFEPRRRCTRVVSLTLVDPCMTTMPTR